MGREAVVKEARIWHIIIIIHNNIHGCVVKSGKTFQRECQPSLSRNIIFFMPLTFFFFYNLTRFAFINMKLISIASMCVCVSIRSHKSVSISLLR